MRPRLTIFIASLLVGLLCASSLCAQEKPPVKVSRSLGIEIDGHDHSMPFQIFEPSQEGQLETSPSRRLAKWKQPAGMLPLTRVKIRSTYEGDGVRIKLTAVFDDSELPDSSGPKYGEKEEPLATYFAREGETVEVAELTRFGFEPMRLKVVHAPTKPDEPPAPIPQPQIVNPLQSVTVVSFESEPTRATHYNLTLRNLSAKSIIMLEVQSVSGGGRSRQRVEAHVERPLMKPGAVYQMKLSLHDSRRWTPQGYVQNTEPQTWSVGTVIFADGTYEGELKTAAEVAAVGQGRHIQLARVLELLQKMSDVLEQDVAVNLEKLKSQVSTLRIDVDGVFVDELLARFPQLSSNEDRAWLKSNVMSGLKNGREEALFRLTDLEAARTRDAVNFDFQQSLRAINQRLARRMSSH